MKREVTISNRHPRLRFRRARVVRVITTLEANLSALRIPPSALPRGELSLVFLTDPALAKIHGDFMADPKATDVITFAGNAAAGLAGEICVSADTALRYVQAKAADGLARRSSAARSVGGDFSAELTLYLVHGWLHLAGYDDLKPAKKRRMRTAEQRAMALLRAAKAVPEFRMR